MFNKAQTIMLQGTSSDVGKSVLAAAFCRIFVQDGYRTVPFKSQNMSLNSYITPDGYEIGRAQGMQADACRVAATTDMNPILLKPVRDMASQVVVHGKPYKNLDAWAYRNEYLQTAEKIVKASLEKLQNDYDRIVIEGAGSPAEVNLKERDIVNMRLAAWADAPVILVADIDRGGVFASIIGTLEILTPDERARIKGFIINKFRGDLGLLKPGLDWLEEKTGKPVLGVVPFLDQLDLEDEDSASLDQKIRMQMRDKNLDVIDNEQNPKLDLAVIRLPRISNFTDFDPLLREHDVRLRYIETVQDFGMPDAVILPGTKNTIEDLQYVKEKGLADQLHHYSSKGGRIVGICGGYQMMGNSVVDPAGVETGGTEEGLGYFSMKTELLQEKTTERVHGIAVLPGLDQTPISGYEIHMGISKFQKEDQHPFLLKVSREGEQAAHYEEGMASADGKIWGTYVHGIFQNDQFRRQWLNQIRMDKGWLPMKESVNYENLREAAFDRLASHVRKHVQMDKIEQIIAGQ